MFACLFACDELTASLWRVDRVTSRPGDELTVWRVDRVTSWLSPVLISGHFPPLQPPTLCLDPPGSRYLSVQGIEIREGKFPFPLSSESCRMGFSLCMFWLVAILHPLHIYAYNYATYKFAGVEQCVMKKVRRKMNTYIRQNTLDNAYHHI